MGASGNYWSTVRKYATDTPAPEGEASSSDEMGAVPTDGIVEEEPAEDEAEEKDE